MNVPTEFAAIKIGVLAGITFRSILSKLIALVDAVLLRLYARTPSGSVFEAVKGVSSYKLL